jgi:hypothetical protein
MWYSGWLKKLRERLQIPHEWTGDLSAVYWEGSPESAHPVREITMKGAQIETATTWPRGTLILISLRHQPPNGRCQQTLANLWSQVVGCEPGGLSIDFVFSSPAERRCLRRFLKALDRRLDQEPQGRPSDKSTARRADVGQPSERGQQSVLGGPPPLGGPQSKRGRPDGPGTASQFESNAPAKHKPGRQGQNEAMPARDTPKVIEVPKIKPGAQSEKKAQGIK